MNRIFFIFLFILFAQLVRSQDTIGMYKEYSGLKHYMLVSEADTLVITEHPNGTRAVQKTLKNQSITGAYKSWDVAGNLVVEGHLIHGKKDGLFTYFSSKGKKMASFSYEEGILKDTVFINQKMILLMGLMTYESTVYGGMQRADGSSNVSHSKGPYRNSYMYAVKVFEDKKPEMITEFITDDDGIFFIEVPKGFVGIFPAYQEFEKIQPGEFVRGNGNSMSMHGGWNLDAPINTTTKSFTYVHLHHSSVGYAP